MMGMMVTLTALLPLAFSRPNAAATRTLTLTGHMYLLRARARGSDQSDQS